MKKTRIIASLLITAIMLLALTFTVSASDSAAPAVGSAAPAAGDAAPAIGGNQSAADAAANTADGTQTKKQPSVWYNVLTLGVPILILVAFFYFGMYKPQKKQEKEKKEMMDTLAVGAEVMTIGGIIGRVVTVREDSVVIESGSDKNKLEISKQAISTVK